MATDTRTDPRRFAHPALLYHTQQEYLDRLVPFVSDGLAVGDPVLVAVPGPKSAASYAAWFGLHPDAAADLQLIANELATSSLRRTGGPCRLALWRQHGSLICETRDGGHLDDRLAGRRPDDHDACEGGLFVVNAVADLVRIHTTAEETTIHAHLRRAA